MTRALIAATVYFLALFTLGFALGIIRVLITAPRLGELVGVILEAPIMLLAAYFMCRWSIRRWNVANTLNIRSIMALLFLALLFSFEVLLGTMLFGRTLADQWVSLETAAGFLGLCAQLISALMLFVVRNPRVI